MAAITDPKVPKIVYSRTSRKSMEGEIFIRQHVFDYIISGTSEVVFEGKKYAFAAGEFRFATRNRLSRFVKTPPEGGEYRSVSICIDQDTLWEIKNQFPKRGQGAGARIPNVFRLRKNQHFKNYIDSLSPYLEGGTELSQNLIKIKIKEAVLIFIDANPELIDVLFDFSEPGKIDLQAYMLEHFACNEELQHFAYLTGRSLSTFKRDFQEVFKTTPNRWLIEQRLKQAYHLIKDRGVKPTEAAMDSGFKNYSHFSTSFKKAFGKAPAFA